jgi:hypothetical protein
MYLFLGMKKDKLVSMELRNSKIKWTLKNSMCFLAQAPEKMIVVRNATLLKQFHHHLQSITLRRQVLHPHTIIEPNQLAYLWLSPNLQPTHILKPRYFLIEEEIQQTTQSNNL